jgi:hypothetical protein
MTFVLQPTRFSCHNWCGVGERIFCTLPQRSAKSLRVLVEQYAPAGSIETARLNLPFDLRTPQEIAAGTAPLSLQQTGDVGDIST